MRRNNDEKYTVPSNLNATIPHGHFGFAIGIRSTCNVGHSGSRSPGLALCRTLLLVLLLWRVRQIVPLDRHSPPSRGVVLGGTVVILLVWRRALVIAGRGQSRSLLGSCRHDCRHLGRSTIAVEIALRFRVAVVVARRHLLLRNRWLLLTETGGDRSRPATRLAGL